MAADPIFPRGSRVVVTCDGIEYRGAVVGYLPGFGTRLPPSMMIDEGLRWRKFNRERCTVRLDGEDSGVTADTGGTG